MSSKFLKDDERIYTGEENGGGITRRRFQCSAAMATCDGLYDLGEYELNQLPLTPKPVKQEKEETPRVGDEDKEIETFLRDREMKKLRDGAIAMKKVMDSDGVLTRGGGDGGDGLGYRHCDMTGEECMDVCEELWVDFKLWANHHENMSQSFSKTRNFVARHYTTMLLVAILFIWFRWYIGAGKEACDRGFGIGLCSFICEIARKLGEIAVGIILGIGGFCAGLLPLLLGVCVYEIKNMDSHDARVRSEEDHEKKSK